VWFSDETHQVAQANNPLTSALAIPPAHPIAKEQGNSHLWGADHEQFAMALVTTLLQTYERQFFPFCLTFITKPIVPLQPLFQDFKTQ
jgi:hypothetical protein